MEPLNSLMLRLGIAVASLKFSKDCQSSFKTEIRSEWLVEQARESLL